MPRTSVTAGITTLLFALASSALLHAQERHALHHRYKLIDIGTFGGPNSALNSGEFITLFSPVLNNRGALVGGADTSSPDPYCLQATGDCYVAHAFRWEADIRTDLGALVQSRNSFAEWISPNGLIAGFSENGEFDPLSGLTEVRAVLWRNGGIVNLGTLPGGYESWANAANSKGEVAGWATNTVADPNSMTAGFGDTTQTRAFLWHEGAMQDLGTLGSGTDAMARFINERGQVVGWSYTGAPAAANSTCGPGWTMAVDSFIWDEKHGVRDLGTFGGTCTLALAIREDGSIIGLSTNEQELSRAFLWKNGSMQDLGGSIGGQQANPFAINESGQVVGFATLAGEVLHHAALWTRPGEITDLGTPDPNECSMALAINAKSQMVGQSDDCASFASIHALLWDNGSLFDLNGLIAPGATLTLQFADNINDTGEIAGQGLDTSGNLHAFLLIPCDEAHRDVEGCDYSLVDAVTAAQRPSEANQNYQLQKALRHELRRFGLRRP
jgi:probable HAF family extracellular repeat protein